MRDSYTSELEKIRKGRFKGGDQQHRFKWIAEEKKLKLLYDKLKEGRYIQSTRKEFEQLFNGHEASSIKPIQWRATQWEFCFLIDYLLQEKLKLILKCNHIMIAASYLLERIGSHSKKIH